MKKWTALLAVLVLLWTVAGAGAEAVAASDLYDLYEETAEGKTWICTAVPISEGVTIASSAGMPDNPEKLVLWDGKAFREVAVMLSTAQGAVAVLLHETDGEQPGIPEFPILEASRRVQAGELIVRSGDRLQSRINREVLDMSATTWKNRNAMLMTLSGETTPGAPVITWDGKLAGIIVSQYAEGLNRYLALMVDEITVCLNEADMLLNGGEISTAPEGYKVTADGNILTFDWSEMTLPEPGTGEKLYHIVADMENSYLTYTEVEKGMTGISMLLTPGRTYVSGLAVLSGPPDDVPEQIAVTAIPEAEPLTDYEFRSVTFALAELQEGASENDMPVPVTEVTQDLLKSGRACIYSVSTYKVEREISGCSLLITLTAPDGNNYRYESSWYYMPEFNEKDEWYVTLEMSGLTGLMDGRYPTGTYEVCMYVDGKLADSFSFTLTK